MNRLPVKQSRRRGMTLIEVVLASALTLVLAAGAMDLFLRVVREQARLESLMGVRRESRLIMQALVRDLSGATDVTARPAPGEGNRTVLTLRRAADGKPVEYRFAQGNLERLTPEDKNPQTLGFHVKHFSVVRSGSMLRVELVCEDEALQSPVRSALETSFWIGGTQ